MRASRPPAASNVSVHMSASLIHEYGEGTHSTIGAVAVPAITRKIIRWSRRCNQARVLGCQRPRSYRALAPNIPETEEAYTAAIAVRPAPWTATINSVPITNDASKQTKCSQPRRRGLS
jgi:hypothetical protein